MIGGSNFGFCREWEIGLAVFFTRKCFLRDFFYPNHKSRSISSTEPLCETDCVRNIENIVPIESRYADECLEPITESVFISNFAKSGNSSELQYPLSETRDFFNRTSRAPHSRSSESNPSVFPSFSHPCSIETTKLNLPRKIECNFAGLNVQYKDKRCDIAKPISRVSPQVFQNNKATDSATVSREKIAGFDVDRWDTDDDRDEFWEENEEIDCYDAKADILQILEDEDRSDSYNGFVSENFVHNIKNKKVENNLAQALSSENKIKNVLESSRRTSVSERLNKEFLLEKSDNLKTGSESKIKTGEWKLEKNIQMYHLCSLTSQLSEEDRIKNEIIFLELFGEDSDEEDQEYSNNYNLYWNSCLERISPWVVKYLMPYYNHHRIVGRNVFKKLGLHISKLIIKKIQYPDEKLVQYFVSKFFHCSSTIFSSERDIDEIKINL